MMPLLRFILLSPLGMCSGGGSAPAPAPLPPPPAEQVSAEVTAARDQERQRRRAAASQTVLTSPQGLTGTNMTGNGKTLLGQ